MSSSDSNIIQLINICTIVSVACHGSRLVAGNSDHPFRGSNCGQIGKASRLVCSSWIILIEVKRKRDCTKEFEDSFNWIP